ncbi:MAG: hypothetical protein Q7S68_02140 [Deltaproteobacteria bacterium]|nr:hypothetical protein [Deltaproteobacteria bacterium]
MSDIPKLRLKPEQNAGSSGQTGTVGWVVSEPNPFVNGQTLLTQYESLRTLILGGYDWLHQNAPELEEQWYGRLGMGIVGSYLMGWNMMLAHEGGHALGDNRSVSEAFGFSETEFFTYHTIGFNEWHLWVAPFPTGGYHHTAQYEPLLQRNGNVGVIQLLDELQNVAATAGWNIEEDASSHTIENTHTQGAQTHFLDSSVHVWQRLAQIIYILKPSAEGERGDPASYMAHLYLDGESAPVDHLLAQVLLRDALDINLLMGIYNFYQYVGTGNPSLEIPSLTLDSWRLSIPAVSLYFMPSGFFYNLTSYVSNKSNGFTLIPTVGARINLAPYQTEHQAVEKLPPDDPWRTAFDPIYERFHHEEFPDPLFRAGMKVVADVGSDDRWYLPHRISAEVALSVNESSNGQQKPGILAEAGLDWHPLGWLDDSATRNLNLSTQLGFANADIRKNLVEFEPPGVYYDVKAGYELTF